MGSKPERAKAFDVASVRQRDGSPVTVTARSLFLTRDLRAQTSTEAIYDAALGAHGPPVWHHDTLMGGLGLFGAQIDALSGKRVLDVGSGLSPLATELTALGVLVDTADADFDTDHPAFEAASIALRRSYADEMELLLCLSQHQRLERYRMDAVTADILARCVDLRAHVVATFPSGPTVRYRTDARDLAPIEEAAYDAVLSAWLFVHLDDDAQALATAAMVRVTKVGGTVRIKAGQGGSSGAAFDRAFRRRADGAYEVAHRVVTILPETKRDLLVLYVDG